ncbi:MAG TPA: hypothetical protein PLL88_06420 [Anaerolineaceae bacterium]|nr:hypothetical protein [Anaerolineaceae bacterium]
MEFDSACGGICCIGSMVKCFVRSALAAIAVLSMSGGGRLA